TLPAGVTIVGTPTAAQCNGTVSTGTSGGQDTVTLTGGSLNGGDASCSLTLDVTSASAGVYDNTPSDISGTSSLKNLANATLTVLVSETDLSLTKTANTLTPAIGESVTYTLTVTNNGAAPATNIEVSDILPAGVTYVSDDSGGTQGAPVDYDPGNGVWTIASIASASSATLDIIVTVEATGDLTNRAEIIAADLPDPDSDVTESFDVDDLNDGLPDDDEAELTLVRTGLTVSGHVFLDNGIGAGASAHNGLIEGNEAGLGGVSVEALQGGNVIASAQADGDGNYTLVLPTGSAGTAVTLRVTGVDAAYTHISGTPGALPVLTDPDATDGTLDFVPAAGGIYTSVDFGLVEVPRLAEGQDRTAIPGGAALFPHTFTSETAMSVDFNLQNETQSIPDAFTSVLFEDTDCDGVLDAGEGLVANPYALAAGEQVCLLVRASVTAGVPDGAVLNYGLEAASTYSGTAKTLTLSNSDRLTVSSAGGLILKKEVCNATISVCDLVAGTGFGLTNSGAPGDTLLYRITFSNPGPDAIDDVRIADATPPYSALTANAPSIVTQPTGLTCTLAVPATPAAGYSGVLSWDCPGAMNSGASGTVGFEISIDQ
ncbi:MAG: DUF11 domain-containing protein, partial [Hyphomonadaceae bacterium]